MQLRASIGDFRDILHWVVFSLPDNTVLFYPEIEYCNELMKFYRFCTNSKKKECRIVLVILSRQFTISMFILYAKLQIYI